MAPRVVYSLDKLPHTVLEALAEFLCGHCTVPDPRRRRTCFGLHSELTPEEVRQVRNLANLSRLSRTCRQLNRAVLPILYHRPFTFGRGWVSLARTLMGNPAISKYVKELSMLTWDTSRVKLLQSDREFFEQMSRAPYASQTASDSRPGVSWASLYGHGIGAQLLLHLPNLEELEIVVGPDFLFNRAIHSIPFDLLRKLKFLHIAHIGEASGVSMNWAAHILSGARNLEKLVTWQVKPPSQMRDEQAPFPTPSQRLLTTLKTSLRFNHLTTLALQKVNFSAKTLTGFLKCCPAVKKLDLRYVRLDSQSHAFFPHELPQVLADANLLRKIRVLRYHTSRWAYGDHLNDDNGDDTKHLTDLTGMTSLEALELTTTCLFDYSRIHDVVVLGRDDRDMLVKLLPASIQGVRLLDLIGNIEGSNWMLAGLAQAENLRELFPKLRLVQLGGKESAWDSYWHFIKDDFARKGVLFRVPGLNGRSFRWRDEGCTFECQDIGTHVSRRR